MNPVVHFEMPAENIKRMSDFYAKAFGWNAKEMGAEYGNYIIVQTTEADTQGMPLKNGVINGGFYAKTKEMGDMHPSIVIAVDDINASMKKVADAGGKILGGMNTEGKPDDIPGIGLYVSFIDTEGNRVGMLQPSEMNK